MANLVLYRKYRPQSFSEIIGQEHIARTLANAISQKMTSHAYLFAGPRGSGKTTLARLLAKSLNCRERKEGEFEPCNRCSSCLEIKEGRSLDLIEIDAASHRGIDEIRELKEGIKFSPAKEKYKVFILDEAHQLTKEAANALLKILEEPPSYAVFILATTEVHKMISTIISRCQRFDFRKLRLEEIVKRLGLICQKEKAKVDNSALELIALNSGGSIRDAESLLDQALTFAEVLKGESELISAEDVRKLLGVADTGLISRFVDCLIEKKGKEAVILLNDIFEKGYDPQEFVKSLINYLRQAILMKINPDPMNPVILGLSEEEQKKLALQTEKFQTAELLQALNLFMEAENKIKFSPIPQLPLELAVVEIMEKSEQVNDE